MTQKIKYTLRKNKAVKNLVPAVAGIALAFVVSGQAQASETTEPVSEPAPIVTTENPATNAPEAQPKQTEQAIDSLKHDNEASGKVDIYVSSEQLDKALGQAKEEGVKIEQTETVDKGVATSLEDTTKVQQEIKQDYDTQAKAVDKVTENYKQAKAEHQAETTKIKSENKAKADKFKADTDAFNKETERVNKVNADIKQQNEEATNNYNQEVLSTNAFNEKQEQDYKVAYDNYVKAKDEVTKSNESLKAQYDNAVVEYNNRLKEIAKQEDIDNKLYAEALKKYQEEVDRINKENEAKQVAYQRAKADAEAKKQAVAKENAEIEKQNQQAKQAYDKAMQQYQNDVATYETRKQQAQEANKQLFNKVDFGMEARTQGTAGGLDQGAETGASFMNATVSKDGSFKFNHDMVYAGNVIGYGGLKGKVNHHYSVNKDGSINVFIESVTLDEYVYVNKQNYGEEAQPIYFRAFTPTNEKMFEVSHDGRTSFYKPIGKTYMINKTMTVKPQTNTGLISVIKLHDDWVFDTHGQGYVKYINNNPDPTPVIAIPDKPVAPTPPTPKELKPVPSVDVPPVQLTPLPQKPNEPQKIEKPKEPTPPTYKPVPLAPAKPQPKPLPVKPVLKTFEVLPPKPETPVYKELPTAPVVPVVKYHYNQLASQPQIKKDVVNVDNQDINKGMVAKLSTVKFELELEALPANRKATTKYVLTDNLPKGFEIDVKATEQASQQYQTDYDTSTHTVVFKANKSLLDDMNKDLNKVYQVAYPTVVGKVLNDGATYVNNFKLETNNYKRFSNQVYVTTPGNPNDPNNPNNNLIKPIKHNKNKDGAIIDGKQVLAGSMNYYNLTWDLDQYKGIKSSKEEIAKGFMFIDDYPEEALNLDEKAVTLTDSLNKAVKGVSVSHYDSLDKATKEVQDMLNKANIKPKGAFQIFKADNAEQFFNDYVVKGISINIVSPMEVKSELAKTGAKYENKAYQIDFGNGYETETIVNNVPKLDAKKDVVINVHDKNSIDGQTIQLNQVFNYHLIGSYLPENRADVINQYNFVDDYDQSGDKYDGVYKVYALTDIKLVDGTVIKKDDELTKFTHTKHDNDVIYISFNQEFLKQVSTDSAFQADVYLQMTRIKPGIFENKFSHFVNGNEVLSNTVKTNTPVPPIKEQPKQDKYVKEVRKQLFKEDYKEPVPKKELPKTGLSTSQSGLFGLGLLVTTVLGALGLKRKQD